MPELEAIADWFVQAIHEAGHGSIRRTAEMTGLSQRALYDAVNAERMLPLRVVQALAVGLGHKPEEITRLWAEAKQERDRAEDAERRRSHTAPLTWADIPLPSPAVRDLLEAQDSALDCLPYALLGLVEPPLSAIYVRQRIRNRPTAQHSMEEAPSGESSRSEEKPEQQSIHHDAEPVSQVIRDAPAEISAANSLISLPDALARHDHLLITGEAGAGKSTLASHLARSLCGVWLRRSSIQQAPISEPLIPLRLSASLLASEKGSWSERLRRATLNTLGGGLVSDPPTSLFVGRTQGARWLIFVDGIDEIGDRRLRTELIRTLARHSQLNSDFRLVVTTRPLPPTELAPLREAMLGEFEIQPFEQQELSEYTRKWFDHQSARVPNPQDAADRFLREVVEEGDLKELVRNPLLVTMALVNATLDPSLPSVSSRVNLYENFMERLRNRTTHSAESAFPVWLADSVDKLIRVLAGERINGEEDLISACRNWMREHPPLLVPLPADWEDELPTALAGTGLLVIAGNQLRFLHQSFAEYLASHELAPALADNASLESWIRRACSGTQRSLALFVLCKWAISADGSPDRVIDQVFAHIDADRILFAGSLLMEGLDVGPERRATVIQRIAQLGRSHDVEESQKALTMLSMLDKRHGTALLLETLAAAPELTAVQRLNALFGLSRIKPIVAAHLLAPLLEVMYEPLPKAAQLALQLGDASVQAVRRRLSALLSETDADTWEESIATETYRVLGAAEEVERLAHTVLENPHAGADEIRRVIDAWLDCGEFATIAEKLAVLAHGRPSSDQEGRMVIAQAMERVGASDGAAELAETIIGSSFKISHAQFDAIEMLLKIRGTGAAGLAHQLLHQYREMGCEVWRQARLLQIMTEAGIHCNAKKWVEEVLLGNHFLPMGSASVVKLLIDSRDSTDLAALPSFKDICLRLHPYERASCSEILLDNGLLEEAFQIAELTLLSPNAQDSDYRTAANVLLKIDRRRAIEVLKNQVAETDTSAWSSGVLESLSSDGMLDLDEFSLELAGHILAIGDAEGLHVQTALGAIAGLGGRDGIQKAIKLICSHPALTLARQRVMAQTLAAYSEKEAALTIWRHLLGVRGRNSESFGISILEDLAQALTFEVAKELVQEQLQADPMPTPFQRSRLEGMLAWLSSSPARC
ncbi:NACHT domain-containing protein [Nonomuraea sp. NPDC049695]|uniref:NACHT domain-containing protein n=1 Tax=Nonomuraea sp. NPDC049695 TaxID=3154734 RepID=UPI00342024BF